MTELQWLTGSEIGAAYAARRLSPVELVRALLREIEAHNPDCGAFIHVDAEGALETARRAETDIFAGRSLGPLHGIPLGAKDNIDIAGVATTCHSKILLDNIAPHDAPAIANLRAAGAIMLGKQSLHEFAFGGPSKELPFPFARHPWNTDYHPGGSSSGSGVALAAGFVPLSLGTDAGGSIRNPAGNCGVVGLKPTYDLVSRRGVFPVAFTLDHVGPMARSVADVALFLDGLVGSNTEGRFGADLERGVRGLRIGFVRQWHETDMVADPEVMAALDEVERVLRQEGAEVRNIALPRLQELAAVQRIILLAETWAVHAKWLRERPQDYSTPCRRKVLPGAFLSAGDYVQAQQWRGRMIDAVDDAFRTSTCCSPRAAWIRRSGSTMERASRKPIPARAAAPSISPGIQRLRCRAAFRRRQGCHYRYSSSDALMTRSRCCGSLRPTSGSPNGAIVARARCTAAVPNANVSP